MNKNNFIPLKLALHGIDSRATKTIMLFLQGPCKSAANVVLAAEDADADVFDAEAIDSKKLLESHLHEKMVRPVIVMSLRERVHDGVLHLIKPIKTNDMLLVLDQAKALAKELSKKNVEQDQQLPTEHVKKASDDFFNDELFDFISTASWDEPPKPQGEPEKLRVVLAPENQEAIAKVTIQENPNNTSDKPDSESLASAEDSTHDGQAAEYEIQDKTSDNQEPLPTHFSSEPEDVTEGSGQTEGEAEKQELKTYVSDLERKKTSKHQTAMQLDEKGYHDYIGEIEEINVNDPKQFANASYNPYDYYQGIFQSAYAECLAKSQNLLLKSDWLPITMFPRTKEVWLDANDIEIIGFAGMSLKRKAMTEKMFLTPVDPKAINKGVGLDKFQSVEAFLWKLACWTSKGRYPKDIDYRLPVYLSNWPNFTRLLITPHALRIAALLIQGPRTMGNVAQMLKIQPQYVFVFISAAHAIGLANQAKRVADNLVQPPNVKPSKGKGLLGRILSKLRN
jgi:hypothetical protein